MLEVSVYAGCPGNKIVSRSETGTTWITGNDGHGFHATLFIDEVSALEIVECLSKAFPSTTLKLQREWIDAMIHRNKYGDMIPTSTVTEDKKV